MIKFGVQVPKIPDNLGKWDIVFKTFSNHTVGYRLDNEGKKELQQGDFSLLLAEPIMEEFGISKFDFLNEMQHTCALWTMNAKIDEAFRLEKREDEITTNHAYR